MNLPPRRRCSCWPPRHARSLRHQGRDGRRGLGVDATVDAVTRVASGPSTISASGAFAGARYIHRGVGMGGTGPEAARVLAVASPGRRGHASRSPGPPAAQRGDGLVGAEGIEVGVSAKRTRRAPARWSRLGRAKVAVSAGSVSPQPTDTTQSRRRGPRPQRVTCPAPLATALQLGLQVDVGDRDRQVQDVHTEAGAPPPDRHRSCGTTPSAKRASSAAMAWIRLSLPAPWPNADLSISGTPTSARLRAMAHFSSR